MTPTQLNLTSAIKKDIRKLLDFLCTSSGLPYGKVVIEYEYGLSLAEWDEAIDSLPEQTNHYQRSAKTSAFMVYKHSGKRYIYLIIVKAD